MQLLHQSALYLHLLAGATALVMFWVPVVARKGSLNHKRFGRYFAWLMYAVAGSGLLMASLDLIDPLATHPPAPGLSGDALERNLDNIRFTATFLLAISILVLATTRHGWLTILHREDRSVLRRPLQVALMLALLTAGITLLIVGASSSSVLLLIFGTLEVLLAGGMLHYSFKSKLSHPREWWTEHLGGLIASGIGAYTAFFVFGGVSLFGQYLQGSLAGLSIVFWVAPGVIGGIAIGWQTAKYRRKFRVQAHS